MFASKEWTLDLTRKVVREAKKDRPVYFDDYRDKGEIIVGCWTNGKPIYRQFFAQPKITLTGASWGNTVIKHADYNMEEIIHGEVVRTDSTMITHFEDITFAITAGNNYVRALRGATIGMDNGADIILYYTKTTDAPNSFEPSMIKANKIDYQVDNLNVCFQDYSESEIIIGKWIDGKPIYRKVFQGTTPGNTTNTTTSVQICSVLDNLVSFDYIMKDSSNYRFTGAANVGNGEIYSAWLTDLHYIRHRASGSAFFNRPVIWIAEYTKTTDAENSFSMDALLQQYNFNSNIENVVLDEYCSPDDVEEVLG